MNSELLPPLVIGFDRAREGGDESCLTLHVDGKLHVIPDPFASHLIAHLDDFTRTPSRDKALEELAKCWNEARQHRNWDGIKMKDWDRVVTRGDEIAKSYIQGETP